MANVYHWLTGSQTDLYSGVFLTASYGAQAVTGSSRYGSGSAWEIGTSTSSRATLYSGYNVNGSDALPNLGTGDITVAFWWQPNNSAYGGSGQRHLFQYSPGAAVEVYHSADLSSDAQDDYNLYAKFRYGNGTSSKSKAFDIDLTGNPWIKIYASRIGGAFYYTLFDATGSVITDNDGNPATWSDTTQTGDIYEASSSTPHIRIGGDFAYGQTAGGIYDDIFLTLNHGIAAADLETDSDGYAKIDPVINSFSTSATSATNGSSVTLSWDADFGTTLQLLKYVSGLLTNTETVTGQVSKSVTISETVSYKLRATNVYGTVDSQSVQINLSQGGNNMAKITETSNNGLVLQKDMLDDSGDLAAVLQVSGVGVGDLALNTALANLTSADSTEVAAREAGDSTEKARAESVEAVINAALSNEVVDRAAGDSTEKARAESVEALLVAADSTELARAESAELAINIALSAEIDDRKADVNAEEARAESVEAILTAGLSTELVERAAGDSTEKARAESVEALLVAADSTEKARAESVEAVLFAADSTETAARKDGDDSIEVVINNEISTEKAAREAADSTEKARAESVEAVLVAADSTELARAQSVEAALQDDIDKTIFVGTADGEGNLTLKDGDTAFSGIKIVFAKNSDGTIQMDVQAE